MSDPPSPTTIDVPAELEAEAHADQARERAREGGLAETTRTQYARRFERFEEWCKQVGRSALPATPETAAAFLNYYESEHGVTAGTLENYAAAIRDRHVREGHATPTDHPGFQRFLANRRRADRTRETASAKALYAQDLKELIRTCDTTRAKGLRDKALLLVGYAGALRRSEIAQINRSHLDRRPGGYVLFVPAQKNDPDGEGQAKGIPGTGRWTSPSGALDGWLEWLDEHGHTEGPVFRRIDRWGSAHDRLSGEGIRQIVKDRVERAGLDPEGYSPHSLRSGFLTQAAESGASLPDIMAQSGHSDEGTALGYIEVGEALENPAVRALGL